MDVPSFRSKGRSLVPTRAKGLRPTARNGGGRAGYAARLVVIVVALCLAAASCGGSATTSTVNPLQVKSCTVQGRPVCRGAFPHLVAEWAQLRASLAVRPVTLPAAQSPTHTAIQVSNVLLAAEVHTLLINASTAVYVPLLIHTLAVAKDKTAALATVVDQLVAAGLGPSLGSQSIIGYPIRCAEPWARYQPGQIAGTSSYYYQYAQGEARWWQYVCTLIPAPGAAASYGTQKPSHVPVLMMNGTADPQDPPANMSGAQNIWPDSRQLIEPGQSHQIGLQTWMPCGAGLVQSFIEQANAKTLDASCLAQVALPPFLLQW